MGCLMWEAEKAVRTTEPLSQADGGGEQACEVGLVHPQGIVERR
jgi:hypothetical protein